MESAALVYNIRTLSNIMWSKNWKHAPIFQEEN